MKAAPGPEPGAAETATTQSNGNITTLADTAKRVQTWANYGLTPENVRERFEAQGGACPICRRAFVWIGEGVRFVVDHDHGTGRVRGLLCHRCNSGLGQLGDDDVSTLFRAITYLVGDPPEGFAGRRGSDAWEYVASRLKTWSLQKTLLGGRP